MVVQDPGADGVVPADMALKIKPGTRFPFTVVLADEKVLGPGHTWVSVADWCSFLIGAMDEWWTLDWQEGHGMVWGFTRREDAMLFSFTWAR